MTLKIFAPSYSVSSPSEQHGPSERQCAEVRSYSSVDDELPYNMRDTAKEYYLSYVSDDSYDGYVSGLG